MHGDCTHQVLSCLQIHWFSIINSCVTVVLLTGFLATILTRTLKKDFIKYTRDDEAGSAAKTFHLCPINADSYPCLRQTNLTSLRTTQLLLAGSLYLHVQTC